jgi:hypothetical protein
MSIFKETFKDFVFKQLRIREAIVEQGNEINDPNKFISRFGNPRDVIEKKGGGTDTITIDKGAFYTNSISKQCVIRMSSGVDITSSVVLETGEKIGSELAKNYILEGGILDEKGTQRGKDFNNFAKKGGAYGDKSIRSDAKDGFGIVPMPGIVDANIRTVTAYGSLRTAKVNFVCHNRRQLEALELLYMRPGMPILLEWQWSPFIGNDGKIDKKGDYGIKDDWFDKNKTVNDFNLAIIDQKELSGGNYDGFVGFCKNFEIVSRPDGGYDCTTEIIAAGEVLEGLKARKDGHWIEKEDQDIQVDNMEFMLQSILDTSEEKGKEHETSTNNMLEDLFMFSTIMRDYFKMKKELKENKSSDDEDDKYFIWRDDMLKSSFLEWDSNSSMLAIVENFYYKKTYIRWDALCEKINKDIFPLPNPTKLDDPLLKLVYTQSKKGKYDKRVHFLDLENTMEHEEYIKFVPYKLPSSLQGDPLDTISENTLNNSFDPSICLLPKQNTKDVYKNTGDSDKNYIGHIFLCVDHMLEVYRQMAYSGDTPKDDFNLFDYFKKIWEDVNKACVGHHNFILQTELERPERIRIIDLQVDPPENIKPGDLFEFKIQSNKSIVRDFNYNTTIPSALSATIAIAAQAPSSVSDLDQVTFRNFSKGIKSRFTSNTSLSADSSIDKNSIDKNIPANAVQARFQDVQGKQNSPETLYREDIETYMNNIFELQDYIKKVSEGGDIEAETIEGKTFSEISSLASMTEKLTLSLLSRDQTTGNILDTSPSRKSAVIPLKFNAKMDGISGIVIGHVFKVEKDKLPKGYQAEDIAFVVMSESQNITSGQDWTTEISGQLMLLDLGTEGRDAQFKLYFPDIASPIDQGITGQGHGTGFSTEIVDENTSDSGNSDEIEENPVRETDGDKVLPLPADLGGLNLATPSDSKYDEDGNLL